MMLRGLRRLLLHIYFRSIGECVVVFLLKGIRSFQNLSRGHGVRRECTQRFAALL